MQRPALRAIDEATIQQVKACIVEACDPEAILLFGSAARGEARPGSDLDLLVVVDLPDGVTHRDQAQALCAQFEGWFLPLDIVVRSPEQYEREKRLLGMASDIAAHEGRCLYGTP